MGRYFKIIDKIRTDGHVSIVDAPAGSQVLYDEIDAIVGDQWTWYGIPYSIEVDSWGELADPGEIYECDHFVVICLSEEEYEEYQR